MSRVLFAFVVTGAFGSACHPEDIDAMERQPKLLPYAASDLSPGGQAMRAPPTGAVPRERDLDAREPAGPSLTPALLALGRVRFGVACAPCHGLAGDGSSVVATKMEQRPPPSLHEPRIRALSSEAIYAVVRDGYGLMPRGSFRLSPRERWAVVAYVRALQLSQNLALTDAPEPVRERLQERLR
jgi:mono/diheme cytochrome c family protein